MSGVPAAAPSSSVDRIAHDLNILSRVGYHKRGRFDRLAFTERDLRARSVFGALARAAGLSTSTDGFGNVIGELGPDAGPGGTVVIGSHLDTVPTGGRFDGTVGLLAGLEVARRIHEEGPVPHARLRLVMFVCEESSRFGMATLGSKVVAGTVEPEQLLALTDRSGIRLGDLVRPLGVNAETIRASVWPAGSVACYLELHIEQGPVLEHLGVPIGIVTAIAAPTRLRATVEGHQDHSGATPMSLRHDALAAAAELILAVEREGRAGEPAVATVGICDVTPGAYNVVPGLVTLGIDIRSTDLGQKTRIVEAIRGHARAIASMRDLSIDVDMISDEAPITLDPTLTQLLEESCQALKVRFHRMPSGAGHDAMEMAAVAPAAMLFVPSERGVSHREDEWTDPAAIALGSEVLLHATRRLLS